jgi:hypothetical protein
MRLLLMKEVGAMARWSFAFRFVALAVALSCATLISPSPAEVSLAKGYDIRGVVDCGQPDVQYCRETDDIYVWTEDLGGGNRRILVDFSWITVQIARLSQGEYVELEIEDIDSNLVAQRVISRSDPPPKVKRGQPSPEPDVPGPVPTVTPTPTS